MYDLPDELVVSADGPVRIVELNRPDQRNATSAALHAALAEVWDKIAADPGARAVILTGRGRAFSAGGDFGLMTTVIEDEQVRERVVAEARRIVTGITGCPVPVIAAVNGPAVGLGCSMAVLSDLCLISEDAYLADPHIQVGLVAADGAAMVLPLLVGLARAKELIFLGDRIGAAEAARIGLVNRAVPADKLMTEALDLARRLAALPAAALRDTKRVLNLHLSHALGSILDAALLAERESMHSPEHIAIVDQLIAKTR